MYETFDVPVSDGRLRVGRWGGGDRVVLAAHGLTATHAGFDALADQLDNVTLLAPDLRGRGGSRDLGPPYGMSAHADDLVAVLDFAGVDTAVVLGHSMGGFVAVVAAARHPDRVQRLVLVDGGLQPDLGPLADLPVDEAVAALTGPALERLKMTFPTGAAYLDYWRQHPALVADWSDNVERYLAYDLVGAEPELRSSVREAAVLADAESELRSGEVEQALAHLRQPVVLVRAQRGILNQETPLYPDELVESARTVVSQLRDVVVADVNHYTLLLSDRGARAVAQVVRDELDELDELGGS